MGRSLTGVTVLSSALPAEFPPALPGDPVVLAGAIVPAADGLYYLHMIWRWLWV